ncbi:hypothetical protein F2Q69_00010375 [Brassica cretica]|uniref:Uncharacterized protein n=1 Tax=Brassica cretica TaxID=69181 RepID=A0A8S9R5D5_BRACR|nr:hypothetical protein F2Q69_00010375 [Brassica cretica]
MFNILKGVVGGSGTGLKDLPYNIGDPYTSKDDGSQVSVFALTGNDTRDGLLAAFVLTEVETHDGTSAQVTIYIVTEPVMPLSDKIKGAWLESHSEVVLFMNSSRALSWGKQSSFVTLLAFLSLNVSFLTVSTSRLSATPKFHAFSQIEHLETSRRWGVEKRRILSSANFQMLLNSFLGRLCVLKKKLILLRFVVLTIGQDSEVRSKAFQAVEQFLEILKQNYEKTNSGETGGTGGASAIPETAGLIGWAMSSLTLKGKPLDQASHASSSSAPSLASAALNATSTGAKCHHTRSNSDFTDQQMVGETLRMTLAKVMIATKTVGISILSMNQKPAPALSNIQAAQKRPVSQPSRPPVTNLYLNHFAS